MDSTQVQLTISSEVRLIDLVHAATESLANVAGFEGDEALNVGLAVREAVINAIVHGNAQDAAKQVRITLRANGAGMEVRILDEGSGFDPATKPDPRSGDALLATSGRGLLMMRAFVDDVRQQQRDEGFEVTLIKKLGQPSATD